VLVHILALKLGSEISELSDLAQHSFDGEYVFRKIIICQIFPAFSKKNSKKLSCFYTLVQASSQDIKEC